MGKITSLPRHIREELNRRLDDGQTEIEILPWLNQLEQPLPDCSLGAGTMPMRNAQLNPVNPGEPQ